MNSNVASSSDNNNIFNSLVIPNEHKTVENNHSVIIHKGKKFNYVCDINPQTIHSLSGKITNLAGNPIFHGPDPEHKFTYTIAGIDASALSWVIPDQSTFAGMTGAVISGGGSIISGKFLALHLPSANEIHFSTDTLIESIEVGGSGTPITFTTFSAIGAGGTLTIGNGDGANTGLTLIQNAGRFIVEFSIISRE